MLIDWFTVLAQVVNFLILVWILKRFLYHPILAAIDRRDQLVAKTLSSASALAASAQAKLIQLDATRALLDTQREALMQSATADAHTEHDRLVAETQVLCAKQRQEALVERRESDARHGQEIARQAEDQAFAITSKALRELATSSLEAAMSEVFVARLGSLDATAQSALAGALARAPDSIRVTSRFPLNQSQRQAISQALGRILKAPVTPSFDNATGSLGGIEVSMPDYRVSWSLDGYLATLSHQVTARAGAGVQASSQETVVSAPSNTTVPQAAGLPAAATKSVTP